MSRSASIVQSAVQLFEGGQPEQAKETLRRFLQRSPTDAGANKMMAMIHGALHEDDQAFIFITRAAHGAPNDFDAQFMLGNVAMLLKKYKEGVRAYTAALRINPNNHEASDGLAKCLLSLGDYAGAMESYEKAITRQPTNPDTYFRMGVALALLGRTDEAVAVARRGLGAIPGDDSLQEFVVYYQNFLDDVDPVHHRDEHAALGRTYSRLFGRPAPTLKNTRDEKRPLRIGFLSSDFHFHACAFFLESPFRAIDRASTDLYLYSLGSREDDFTAMFSTLGHWRPLAGADPAKVARHVQDDEIDILIECCGWTERANMMACAQRMAPVHVTYLGYPNTTGMPCMDYRLIDALTDPPGSDNQCTETLWRLPSCFLCYRPPAEAPTVVDWTPPCLTGSADAPITFGTFNRPMKVGPEAVDAWARILQRIPHSLLMIKVQIASQEVGPNFVNKFVSRGIAPERIVTAGWKKEAGAHFPMYRQMDIALDSFPYNGTTTTCEATWMGVPVIALTGATHRSRVGHSILNTVGVAELAAPDVGGYVDAAVALANDRTRLAEYHKTLRARMAASPLVDAARFARDFNDAIRGMWTHWCRQGT